MKHPVIGLCLLVVVVWAGMVAVSWHLRHPAQNPAPYYSAWR